MQPTLARGRWRIPYRALGRVNALALHDRIVARRLSKLGGQIDVVHTWPLGALETLRTARRMGITDGAGAAERAHGLRLRGRARGVGAHRRARCLPTTSMRTTRRSCARKRRSTRSPTTSSARRSSRARPSSTRAIPTEKLVRHSTASTSRASSRRRARRAGRPYDGLRRRRGCPQGPPLRARGVAALTGERDGHVPDRRRVPAGVRRAARRHAGAPERPRARPSRRRPRADARERRLRPADDRGGLRARLHRGDSPAAACRSSRRRAPTLRARAERARAPRSATSTRSRVTSRGSTRTGRCSPACEKRGLGPRPRLPGRRQESMLADVYRDVAGERSQRLSA